MKIGCVMLACNQLEMSKRTVKSLREQTVEMPIFVVNNASTDGTAEWLAEEKLQCINSTVNLGISAGWNTGLELMFNICGFDFVFVPNNDTFIPPFLVDELVSYDVPLVTGFEVRTMAELNPLPRIPLVPYPDFSCFLIKRDTWNRVGKFDENLFNYCSDCDYHVRAHRVSLDFWKANVPYYHDRSSTIHLADPVTRQWMEKRADTDREIFQQMYGCLPGTKEYLALLDLS